MTELPVVPLETGWQCDYFEIDPDLYEFAPEPVTITYLSDWRCSGRFTTNWAAYLQRQFDLEPMADVCLRYVLHIASAPTSTRVYINNTLVGEYLNAALTVDVTDHVWLEGNTVALRVVCAEPGTFNGVYLRAVPCRG